MPGNRLLDKRIVVLSILYLCAGIFILACFGIQTGGEAEKYIDNANRILSGSGLRNGVYGFFYVAYSLVVAFFVKLSIPLFFVGLFQLLLSLLAAHCIYRLVSSVTGHGWIAVAVFIVYLLCYPVQKWNFFLYSESLHTSLLVIGLYYFNCFLRQPSIKTGAILLFLLLLVFFSRPTGVLFLFAMIFSLMLWLWIRKQRLAFYMLLAVAVAGVVAVINSPLVAFVNPDSLVRLEVICQVSGTDQNKDYLEFQRSGIGEVYKTIRDDIGIGNFLWTGCKKVVAFFSMYRPYYSLPNNLLLIANWIFYPLALTGIFSKVKPGFYYVRAFALSYLSLIVITVFFTCDDWANRFIAPVFPFVLLLAVMGVHRLSDKVRKT